MNSDKVQEALTLLQEAIDERPPVTLKLKLTDREADLLARICIANVSVPRAVIKALPVFFGKDPHPAEQEMTDLLSKIKRELP